MLARNLAQAHFQPSTLPAGGINDEDWVLKVSTYTEPTQSSKKSSKQRKALLAANAGANLLFWEYNVYRAYLTGVKGVPAHPKDRSWYGKSDGFVYLALERLYGGTLTSRCVSHGVAAATVCKVGAQLIETLEGIHRNGLLFRDVKPDNFMLKNEDGSGRVYCLDFGAAVKYTDRDGDRKKEGSGVEGTPNFMALRVHANSPPAPADDLESLAYMLIWMLKGSLPWEGAGSMQGVVKGKEEAIMDPSVLYEGVSDSDELMAIIEYMNMVIDMDADETPDYKACKEVFTRVTSKTSLHASDWSTRSSKKQRRTTAKKTKPAQSSKKKIRNAKKAASPSKAKVVATKTRTARTRSAGKSAAIRAPTRSSRRIAAKRASEESRSKSPEKSGRNRLVSDELQHQESIRKSFSPLSGILFLYNVAVSDTTTKLTHRSSCT